IITRATSREALEPRDFGGGGGCGLAAAQSHLRDQLPPACSERVTRQKAARHASRQPSDQRLEQSTTDAVPRVHTSVPHFWHASTYPSSGTPNASSPLLSRHITHHQSTDSALITKPHLAPSSRDSSHRPTRDPDGSPDASSNHGVGMSRSWKLFEQHKFWVLNKQLLVIMATESPLRFIENNGADSWILDEDSSEFASTSNLVSEELGLLLKGQKYHGSKNINGLSRSGSAPPSMEGSRAAFDILRNPTADLGVSLENLSNAVQNCGSEEQLRAHPAYLAYYCANVNLNPRLPPPLISRENRHLMQHIGGFGDNRRMPSFDDNSKSSFLFSRPVLSTHNEEPEDDRSPTAESSDWTDKKTVFFPGHSTPVQGRNMYPTDLVQNSYPVYGDHSHHSSHTIIEQAARQNALSNHLNDYSNGMTNSETRTPGAHTCTPHLGSHSVGFVLNGDTGAVPVPGSASTGRTVNLHQGKKKSSSGDTSMDKSVPPGIIIRSDRDNIEDEMKNLRLSTDDHRSHHSRLNSQQVGLYATSSSSHAQIGQSQIIAQGVTHSQNTGDHASYGQPKLPSVEMQPFLQSAGTVPSLYVPGAGYGAPYYHNLQFPSVLPLQFGIGGYTLNPSLVSPLVTAYPPHHSAMPMPFDNVVGPNFSARASGISTGGNAVPGVDMQQLIKIYGQLGLAIQPPFPDPLYMPFYQHYSTDALATSGQYDSKISRGSAVGSPAGTYDLQKGPGSSAYLPEQRPQVMGVGGVNTLNAIKGVTISPGYYGNLPNMGLLMQFPGSPLASPVSQGSPVARASFSGRKNDNTKFPFSSERITGSSGLPIQRGGEKVDDPISYSFLEELKSNKARRYDLSDIAGRIVEFRQVLIFF
ncbi:hypothetical protein BHE74_00054057, partial [Ensete ventricosum]